MAGLSLPDVGPFLARLTRLAPDAVVRLRPAGPAAVVRPDVPTGQPPLMMRTALWGRVPWGVLVTRTVPGDLAADTTVGAAALLRSLTDGDGTLPPSRDPDWRWALPPGPGREVETLSVAELRRVGTAAAATLRAARGRIGERVLRDALLDHVPIVVTVDHDKEPPAGPAQVPAHEKEPPAGPAEVPVQVPAQVPAQVPVHERIEIRQGLVQAMLRMAFTGTNEAGRVTVRIAGTWVGLVAEYGATWLQNTPSLAIRLTK